MRAHYRRRKRATATIPFVLSPSGWSGAGDTGRYAVDGGLRTAVKTCSVKRGQGREGKL